MKKVTSSTSLGELKLSRTIIGNLERNGYSATDVIMAARTGRLRQLDGVSGTTAAKITEAVDEAGFLLHESEKSRAVRRILITAFACDFDLAEYEEQEEFSKWQIEEFMDLLREALKVKEYEMVEMRFGLDGGPGATYSEVGRRYYMNTGLAAETILRALRKLRNPALSWQVTTLFDDFLDRMCHPDENTPKNSLLRLELPNRVYSALMRGGIRDIDELRKAPCGQLVGMRRLGARGLYETMEALRKFDKKNNKN